MTLKTSILLRIFINQYTYILQYTHIPTIMLLCTCIIQYTHIPQSAGKTFVAEVLLLKTLIHGRASTKCILVEPYVSLAKEKAAGLHEFGCVCSRMCVHRYTCINMCVSLAK